MALKEKTYHKLFITNIREVEHFDPFHCILEFEGVDTYGERIHFALSHEESELLKAVLDGKDATITYIMVEQLPKPGGRQLLSWGDGVVVTGYTHSMYNFG